MNDDLSIFTIEDLEEMKNTSEEMYRIVSKSIDHLPVHEVPSYRVLQCHELKIKIELYAKEIEARKTRSVENTSETIGRETGETEVSQSPKAPLRKILILSSNPPDTKWLRLDDEARRIEKQLERAKEREFFEIKTKLAVHFVDMMEALLEYEPNIVHFCGHGDEDGVIVVSESRIAEPVSARAFSELFALCTRHVQCVLLNACFSAVQAESISKHIDYVIGAPGKIPDQACIQFSIGFYAGLGAGKSYEEAFKAGRSCFMQSFTDTPEHLIHVMKKKESLVNHGA